MTREEALRRVKSHLYAALSNEEANEIITALERDPKWIPVSEKLPEKSGNYWCTFGGTNLTGKDYYTTESDAKENYEEPEEYAGWQSHNVIAWMHLPTSFKPQERGKE